MREVRLTDLESRKTISPELTVRLIPTKTFRGAFAVRLEEQRRMHPLAIDRHVEAQTIACESHIVLDSDQHFEILSRGGLDVASSRARLFLKLSVVVFFQVVAAHGHRDLNAGKVLADGHGVRLPVDEAIG